MKINWNKLNRDLKKLGMKPIKPPKTAAQMKKETAKKADSLPLEVKKTFWQAMLDGNNLGESREIAGIDDVMVACELVNRNHLEVHIPKSINEIR